MSNSPTRPGSGGGGTGPGRPTKAALLHGIAGNAVLVGLIAIGIGIDWTVGWR